MSKHSDYLSLTASSIPHSMADYTAQDRIADRLRLPFLHSEITKLQGALAALVTERSLIRRRLHAYTYPVLTLPTEIVSEIFIAYLPAYPNRPALFGDASPLKLTQICASWRQIAHGTPRLWQAIEMPFMTEHGSQFSPNCTAIAENWLSRSSALPLSVAFDVAYGKPQLSAVGTELWNVLASHSSRWKYAQLDLRAIAPAYVAALRTMLPQLMEIDVRLPEGISGTSAVPGALSAPNLVTALVRTRVENPPIIDFLPWVQLTSLSLRDIAVSQVAPILRSAPSLVRCRLKMFDGDALEMPVLPVSLPVLETLIFDFWDQNEDPRDLFLALRTPRLKNLALFPFIDDPVGLKEYTMNRGFHLERLLVAGIGQEEKSAMLAAFPDISHLELSPDMCEANERADEWQWW
ncbi:F-box domain-containing protein [Mycena kentingensis (nom. inval.)]|nr:F-box domain-containing protein [Mycena kentingensis (nom. inval.)]